jgi:hypothetical protein
MNAMLQYVNHHEHKKKFNTNKHAIAISEGAHANSFEFSNKILIWIQGEYLKIRRKSIKAEREPHKMKPLEIWARDCPELMSPFFAKSIAYIGEMEFTKAV